MKISRQKMFILASLVGLSLLIGYLAVSESIGIYDNLRQIKLPTMENRRHNPMRIHNWMTVTEVAKKHGMSENEVFECLRIDPQPGDEQKTLRALREKYHLTPEEMLDSLQRLIDSQDNRGSK